MLSASDMLLWYGAFLIAIVFHEASHAWLAMLGGDRTAYVGGQVTLNPLPHIRREPFGTVILPLVGLLLLRPPFPIGYAHTPIDALWAHRHPKRAALMSAAGPVANLLLAGIAFLALKALIASDVAMFNWAPRLDLVVKPSDEATSGGIYALCKMASVFLFLNLLLAVLNVLPVPPLDGAGVVEGLFPRALGGVYEYVRSQPMLQILIFVGVLYGLPHLFEPVWIQVVWWVR